MNPFAFFLAIADKVHTALNLLDPTRTYAAADALWAQQRGAGRLAEKGAEEEVAEPKSNESQNEPSFDFGDCGIGSVNDKACIDPTIPASLLADLPGIPPTVWSSKTPDSDRLDRIAALLENLANPCFEGALLDRLDHQTALLEDIRNLLQPKASTTIWDHIAQHTSAAPASQTDAPGEASGVPEGVSTPDPDAPSGHLTLGNDPAAIHARALRRIFHEDGRL
jgi:hypothetical protein